MHILNVSTPGQTLVSTLFLNMPCVDSIIGIHSFLHAQHLALKG